MPLFIVATPLEANSHPVAELIRAALARAEDIDGPAADQYVELMLSVANYVYQSAANCAALAQKNSDGIDQIAAIEAFLNAHSDSEMMSAKKALTAAGSPHSRTSL